MTFKDSFADFLRSAEKAQLYQLLKTHSETAGNICYTKIGITRAVLSELGVILRLTDPDKPLAIKQFWRIEPVWRIGAEGGDVFSPTFYLFVAIGETEDELLSDKIPGLFLG